MKRTRPLKMKKKIYEFYAAPITKFYCHFIAYMIFLVLYTYMCLVRTPPLPSVPEYLVTAYIVTFGLEKVRQLCACEPSGLSEKWRVWVADSKWHLLDLGAIVIYLLGFSLRWDPSTRSYGRVTYCTVINYYFVRLLKFLSVSKYFGPVVTMMYRMVKNMLYFIVLILVVLVSFGVCNQSIKYPNEDWDWRLLRHVFYQPYFMLYGEVYAPDIDPDCNPECEVYGECGETIDGTLLVPCHTGRWVTPIAMTLYLLCANILIINLLIAVFNNIYIQISAVSHEVWNFQRYSVVMEYEEKPILPPPFIFISHIQRLIRSVYRRFTGAHANLESGLKLFLDRYDLEKLYDFEEECVELYMRHLEESKLDNTEVRVKNIVSRTEKLSHKMEIINTNMSNMRGDLQANEIGLRKLEEICEQTANQLAVIHRFMSTHIESMDASHDFGFEDIGKAPAAGTRRKSVSRTLSERSSQLEQGTELEERSKKTTGRRLKSPSPFDQSPYGSPLLHPRSAVGKIKKLRHSSSGSEKKLRKLSSLDSSQRRRRITESSEHDIGSDICEESEHADHEMDKEDVTDWRAEDQEAKHREEEEEEEPSSRNLSVRVNRSLSENAASQGHESQNDRDSYSDSKEHKEFLLVYNRYRPPHFLVSENDSQK